MTLHQGPHFILYSRSYCHLCEDMLAALRAFMAHAGLTWTVDVIDVDSNPQLTDRFDELVPVLYAVAASTGSQDDSRGLAGPGGPAGQELCHYFLDEAALQRFLIHYQDQAASR